MTCVSFLSPCMLHVCCSLGCSVLVRLSFSPCEYKLLFGQVQPASVVFLLSLNALKFNFVSPIKHVTLVEDVSKK